MEKNSYKLNNAASFIGESSSKSIPSHVVAKSRLLDSVVGV